PGHVDQRADLADRRVGLGRRERAELRIARVGDRRVILARGQDEGRVAEVEGAIEPQIERAGYPALDLVGRLRLERVDPGERLGRHILQIETAPGGGHDLAPVHRRQNVGEAADADGRQLVVAVILYLNTGDTLQCGGD